jgi:hypothetical protein
MKLVRSRVHTKPQLIVTRPCTFRLTCLPRSQKPLHALTKRPSGSRQNLKVAAMAAVAPSVSRYECRKFKISLAADQFNFYYMQSGPVTEKDYETLVLKLHEIQVNCSSKTLIL